MENYKDSLFISWIVFSIANDLVPWQKPILPTRQHVHPHKKEILLSWRFSVDHLVMYSD